MTEVDRYQNSTNYVHPNESNLLNVHKVMQYNSAGEPVLRTTVEGITLEAGDVIIDKVRVEVDPLHNTISATNPVPAYFPNTQTVSINQPIAVTDNNNSLTVDNTGTFRVQAEQQGTWTVEVSNDVGNPLSISANTTTNSANNPLYTEVSNDVGNPLPISKNTSTNSDLNPIFVQSANVASTSKDRMKITSYSTGFFNTFQHGKEPDIWDESTSTGATSTWDGNRNAVNITVSSTVGSKVIRQTKNVMRYVPGRPAEYSQAIILGAHVSGIRQRVGLFDDNDGFFFERAADGNLYCVIRSSVTGTPQETRKIRADWNGDKLNGSGPTGITLDLSKTQLLVVDYEWYGVGVVKFSLVINNQTVDLHTFYHANTISDPWCSTPFIPMRVEMENVSTSTSATMYQISSCHSMEAFSDNLGIPISVATSITGKTLTTQNTYYPVLSIRLKSTALNGVVIPQYLQAGTTDNTFINYQLILNPTLTGASWINHPSADSIVQYDLSATAFTGGTILNQGFAASGYNDRLSLNENAASGNFQIGRSSLGTVSDILTIAIAAGNSNKAGIAVMNWIEQR